jgi:hypothetical protein
MTTRVLIVNQGPAAIRVLDTPAVDGIVTDGIFNNALPCVTIPANSHREVTVYGSKALVIEEVIENADVTEHNTVRQSRCV